MQPPRPQSLSKAEVIPEDGGERGAKITFQREGGCWATGGEEQRAAQILQSCPHELFTE